MMSEQFKTVIKDYLDIMAAQSITFKTLYDNPDKNLDACLKYILTEVKKSGCEGFADEEIYTMAENYYKLPTVEIDEKLTANVVVNRSLPKPVKPAKITTEEKKETPNPQLSLF